jgi:filamentous hemagglutinin family protein
MEHPMQDALRSYIFLPALLSVALAAPGSATSQVITDGSVGPKVSLRGGQIEIGAALGSQRGDNLFHSFERFGIATGQTATFTGPDTIQNVISRVTGGEASHLDGTLASKVGQADLYFINPAGVVFGPNAKLDVPGSLHVSTAHELRFADGVSFSALDKTGSGLTVAAPEAFGFLDRTAGPIRVEQSQLQLQPGKMLSLIGGNLDIVGGRLGFIEDQASSMAAPSGTVNLTSVTSAGQVRVAESTVTAPQLGTIQLTDQALIDTSGNGGGRIAIRGGQITVTGSNILAGNTGPQHATGGIDIAGDTVRVTDNSTIASGTFAQGNAGTVMVSGRDIEVLNGGEIGSSTFAVGHAGQVSVTADRLIISGDGATTLTGISSNATRESTGGSAGTVTVTGRDIEVRNGGQIVSDTFAQGNAGTVQVRADRLLFISAGEPATFTGISSESVEDATGKAGNVKVHAGELQVRDGGEISTSTGGIGPGGAVTVEAGTLEISGGYLSARSENSAADAGPGGTVHITARDLQVRNSGAIATSSMGGNVAGDIMIEATDAMRLETGTISTQAEAADGGRVAIKVGNLIDLQDSAITTSVAGLAGNGGNIFIDPRFFILDNSRIVAQARGGNGGNIFIDAGTLIQSPGSVIDATSELGISGTINVTAPNVDVAGSLVVLPETFLDASSRLREACARQGGMPTSSLIAGGQGGMPPDPGAPLSINPFSSLASGHHSDQLPHSAATLPLAPSTKGTLIAANPVLGAPRISCRG